MGYFGKLEEREKAIGFRKRGFSYNEIQKRVPVSKSTLSLWCRNVVISEKQAIELIEKRKRGADKGRMISAKRQQKKRIERTKKLLMRGKSETGRLLKRDRFIAGIALYAGDGLKGDKQVGFSNSNAAIVKFMVEWFREFTEINESRLRASIWIHGDLDKNEAKKFWSETTRIPESQFLKTYVVKNKKSRKIRKKVNKNGILAIRIFDTDLQRLIKGWMSGVLGSDIV